MTTNSTSPAQELAAAAAAAAAADEMLDYHLERATRGFGLRQVDLRDAGCTDYMARRWGAVEPDFGSDTAMLVGGTATHQRDDDDVVALIATRAGQRMGAQQYSEGVYLRDRSLGQPVRHIATVLGTDEDRTIKTVRPILARYLLKSARHQPDTFATADIKVRLLACLNDAVVQKTWPDPLDAFVLGEPIPVDLPLGWRGGIPGTRHHRLGDLLHAETLRGIPTV